MRLFAAIDLPDDARRAIAAKQARVRRALGEGAPVKWVRPEQMHLTLVFIGEVPEDRVPAFVAAMQQPIAQAPFALTFAGTGVFPPRGAPRVLWIGVEEGSAAAVALQAAVAARLAAFGVTPEARPYSPHLTLGRWRDPRPSDKRRLPDSDTAVVARIEVAAVTLFQSRISSSGPAYTALATAPLYR